MCPCESKYQSSAQLAPKTQKQLVAHSIASLNVQTSKFWMRWTNSHHKLHNCNHILVKVSAQAYKLKHFKVERTSLNFAIKTTNIIKNDLATQLRMCSIVNLIVSTSPLNNELPNFWTWSLEAKVKLEKKLSGSWKLHINLNYLNSLTYTARGFCLFMG